MMANPTRISPLSTVLQGYAFAPPDTLRETAMDLAFCDVSDFTRCVLKGKDAVAYLKDAGLEIPEKINGVVEIGGGLVMRTGGAEWLIESHTIPDSGPSLRPPRGGGPFALANGSIRLAYSQEPQAYLQGERALPSGGDGVGFWVGLYPAPGASFLLSGSRASDILLETCNVDLRSPGPDLVMTRIAGVSCYILHRTLNGIPACQVWSDASYAHYLGETLLAIIHEHNGGVAGVSCYFPEVLLPQT